MKRLTTISLLLLLLSLAINAQKAETFEAINNQVWEPFMDVFNTLNTDAMYKLHATDVIRVPFSRGLVQDYNDYMQEYEDWFNYLKEENQTIDVSLRFFERINNDSIATEVGYYRSINNKGREDEKAWYGRFFVVLKRVEGEWKILVDYDSQLNDNITEEIFNSAYAIDDFQAFLKKED